MNWVALSSMLSLGLASVSAAGTSPLSFSDEAASRGVSYVISPFTQIQFGSGLGLLDLDGDHDLDIILTGRTGNAIGLYENDGTGNFTDRSIGSGIGALNVSSVSCADYDNDGDQDIFFGGWLVPSKLYRNNGDFTFTDVSVPAGVAVNGASMGSSWGDFDKDGYQDLYYSARTNTSNNTTKNHLFRNNGDGTFTDVALALNVDAEEDPTLVSAFFDFDRDGDDDLYLGTDKGNSGQWWNRLYRNDGGTFTEITDDANARAYIDCMGIAITDLNNDSYFDVYMTDTMRNPLFVQDGSGAFVDQSDTAGVTSGAVGWGCVFADFDNDSFSDLYVCNLVAPNRLYRGEDIADWPMVDEGPAAGVALSGTSYCVAVGDVNNDGLLDMLVGHVGQPVKLFINQSPDAAANHMLRLRPVLGAQDLKAVGTCMNVLANGKWQAGELRSGVNYKASEGDTLHFGLGTDTEALAVDIVWPGGMTRQLTGVPADHTWTVYEQERIGDLNNDGNVDWSERSAALDAWTGPGVKITPGSEIFDYDGDFDIDDNDIAGMSPCTPDLTGDGSLNFLDVSYFLTNTVDYNGDMSFNFLDVSGFLQEFGMGCP